MMKFFGVCIFVNNLGEVKFFYCDLLGFDIVWDMEEMGVFGVDVGVQFIVE